MSDKEREARTSESHLTPSCPLPPTSCPTDPDPYSTPSTPIMSPPTTPPLAATLQNTPYWKVTPVTDRAPVWGVPQGAVSPPPASKSLLEAYLLWFALGVFGAHHFYLGRLGIGVMYFFSGGLLGLGWLVDLVRMPCLVAQVNRANMDKHQQLQALQQQLHQQRLQQVQQFGPAVAERMAPNVVFLAYEPRNLLDAYILWFPLGLLGFHHYYLRNYTMAIVYNLTLGLVGIGWLVDLFRMPSLVREANEARERPRGRYSQCTAHVLAISPAGLLGGHHFYLNRPVWGSLYACTLGLVGLGWLCDWLRTSCLVKRANAVRQGYRSPYYKDLDDAYLLCFPLGMLGLHHFYLGRHGWGILYFCTLGVLGLGWVLDWFRLPFLVKDYNSRLEMSERLVPASNGRTDQATAGVPVSAGLANDGMVIHTQGTTGAGGYGGCHPGTYPGPVAGNATYPSYVPSPLSLNGNTGPAVMPQPPQYGATYPEQFNVPAPEEHAGAPPSYEDAIHSQDSHSKQ